MLQKNYRQSSHLKVCGSKLHFAVYAELLFTRPRHLTLRVSSFNYMYVTMCSNMFFHSQTHAYILSHTLLKAYYNHNRHSYYNVSHTVTCVIVQSCQLYVMKFHRIGELYWILYAMKIFSRLD